MKKNKKLFLASIAAMGAVAIGTGAVSTFAWYASSANASIANGNNVAGSIESASTTLDVANGYHIKLTVNEVTGVQLSHLGTGSDYINGSSGDKYVAGTLYKGVYVTDSSLVRVDALADDGLADFVKAYTVTAEWCNSNGTTTGTPKPSDVYDVAYLGGKKFTVNLTAAGSAKLCKKNNKASGLNAGGEEANATSATCVVHIAASTLNLTVDTYSLGYVRLEPTQLQGSEDGSAHGGSTDKITPAAVVSDGKIVLTAE